MQARRKNMERMAEVVVDSDEQALQHFLSNSPWDERGVLDQVARNADALLGGTPDSALLIDESGITKNGRHSVGVARQWNGRLGKVDNGQVGVFAALSRGALATLIDTRLYLPKGWVDDARRRVLAAGCPRAPGRSAARRSWRWRCRGGYAGVAAGADAGATLLGRTSVPRWLEPRGTRSLPGARLAGLASPPGAGHDGDAVHVEGARCRR